MFVLGLILQENRSVRICCLYINKHNTEIPLCAAICDIAGNVKFFIHFLPLTGNVALCSLGNHCAVVACNPIEQNMLGALLLARLQSVSESLLFSGRAVYEAIS